MLLGSVAFPAGLEPATSRFLVAASPCALAVATPVTFVAAIGAAARKSVLIKGGVVLESLGRLNAIALDKTGTLTHGFLTLTKIHAQQGSESDLLRLTAAVEHYSDHPIARAIVRAADERKVARSPVEGFRSGHSQTIIDFYVRCFIKYR